jgi:hypothetical protein
MHALPHVSSRVPATKTKDQAQNRINLRPIQRYWVNAGGSQLPSTVHRPLPTAHCPLPHCPTAHCPLPTAYRLAVRL